MTGSYRQDFARANALAGFDQTPTGYIWHHHQDTGLMQLVPTDLHNAARHTGGTEFWEQAIGRAYRR